MPPAKSPSGLWPNIAIGLVATVVSLLALEMLFRLMQGIDIFDPADWRRERVTVKRLGDRADVDPLLGWSLRPGFVSAGFNTIEHGIRRNGKETTLRTGGILAVGDSYTEGWSDVQDHETWPARLEAQLGVPVINAGVGGYATDQIILRAEQLLPIVRPRILIVGFNEIDIFKTAHAPFGAPKPYFTLAGTDLEYHPPQPMDAAPGLLASIHNRIRGLLGYSAVLNTVMSRLAPNYWYSDSQHLYQRVHNDEIAVTCRLLQRVKAATEKAGIRMLLFMQHGGWPIISSPTPLPNARAVVECAEQAGIAVLDQFAPLRAIAVADPKALQDYYTMDGHIFGHMSAKGNQHAADMLAKALGPVGVPVGGG